MQLEARGEPQLSIKLGHSADPVVDGCFLPLLLADQAELSLSGLLRLIERLDATAELTLGPEGCRIPLALGPATLALELDPKAQIALLLRLDPGTPNARLARAVISCAPALELASPLASLRELLFSSGWIRSAVERLRATLPPQLMPIIESVGMSTDSIVGLEISEVALEANDEADRLELRISGALRLFGQLSLPLERLKVPAALLPNLSPSLAELVTQLQQFARDAELEKRGPKLETNALGAATDYLERARFALKTQARLPELQLEASAPDGIQTTLQATLTEPLIASARGELRRPKGQRTLQHEASLELRAAKRTAQFGIQGHLPTRVRDAGDPTVATDGRDAPRMTLSLAAGSQLPDMQLRVQRRHPLLDGQATGALDLTEIEVAADTSVEWCAGQPRVRCTRPVSASGRIGPLSTIAIDEGEAKLTSAFHGSVRFDANQRPDGWQLNGQIEASAETELQAHVTPIPELSLHDGLLAGGARTGVEATIQLQIGAEGARYSVDLAGSRVALRLLESRLRLDACALQLPLDTRLDGSVQCGGISAEGLLPWSVDLSWDLQGEPFLLQRCGGTTDADAVSLLTPALRQGTICVHLSDSGRLSFSGAQEGLYGERYFNALIDPASDPLEWYEILASDDAFAHIVAALELVAPAGAELLADVRQLIITTREIARREGVRQPDDLIPRTRMARALSLLLAGHPRLEGELAPMIKQVTDGHGLPLSATRQLLEHELGPAAGGFVVGALLNLFDLVLRPGPAVTMATAAEEPPLCSSGVHAHLLQGLPSAAQIQRIVRSGAPDRATVAQISALAPLLTSAQLDDILQHAHPAQWHADLLDHVHLVRQLKRRIAPLADGYGGIAHAAQPMTIGLFLGRALSITLPAGFSDAALAPPPLLVARCALGPEEIATLLRAGLASTRQGRRCQLNNRLLIELLKEGPAELSSAVLLELGHRSPRALSGLLYALLEQDQHKLAAPLDLPGLIAEKLEIDAPRQVDYLAGGRRARDSYYEDLSHLADHISAGADGYLAIKQHLQQVRHPTAGPLQLKHGHRDLAERACQAIAVADKEASGVGSGRSGRTARRRAGARYDEAFARCAELLRAQPRAVQLDWLRQFWQRSEEALRVLSVVRAHQLDIDHVRHWLAVRSGRERFRSESALLQAVVVALYAFSSDQQQLLADPLVRLLLDPSAGHYDFTLVSCMGLITDGEHGAELEHAYRRLAEQRGIRIVRAATGTGRPLEYNARRIIEAISRCDSPFGIIGYSQGLRQRLARREHPAQRYARAATTTRRAGSTQHALLLGERFRTWCGGNAEVQPCHGRRRTLIEALPGVLFVGGNSNGAPRATRRARCPSLSHLAGGGALDHPGAGARAAPRRPIPRRCTDLIEPNHRGRRSSARGARVHRTRPRRTDRRQPSRHTSSAERCEPRSATRIE
jgi:hypothetical protein